MSHEILIRRATLADVEIVAHHRAAMFLAMDPSLPAVVDRIASETCDYLCDAIPRGEYVGWLASLASHPGDTVAGAGVQTRRTLPFPRRSPDGQADVAWGRQGLVMNVYTEPAFRRRGLARRLMQEVLAWARQTQLDSLVLHAAPDGRPLYEQLGFAPTNEMRLTDGPATPSGLPGQRDNPASHFVICINNESNPASLIPGKVYHTLPDAAAEMHNMLRVIDGDRSERGGRLYPAFMFAPIELPEAVERALTAGDQAG